jgi:dTDP-glucose 4,6-dehydratase
MYYSANESNVLEEISVNKKYKLIKGNLCNTKLITNILDEHNITHVIHFALQSHVQNSFEK